MKKIISLVLALLMCLTVMTSCDALAGLLGGNQTQVPTTTDAELAIQTLTTKYYGKNDGVSRDYDLDRVVVGGSTRFDVQWSVDLETIQVVEKDDRNVTVDLPSDNAEEVTYTLTAKIVDKDGKEYTKSFTLTLPKYTSDPKADSALTIAQALALGAKKASGEYTVGKYYVTGTIKEVYNTKYGNMYIVDEEGNELCVYGTYSADGATRYDALEVKPVAGDVVTVYGVIGKHNTTIQMQNGWITAHTPAGEEVPTYTQVTDLTTLKTGDKVVIGAPAYGKLLSMVKTGNYNVGVDYTPADGGYANVTDDEIYTVTVNADGTYSFVSASGKALAMAAQYSSLNHDGENKTWNITAVEGKTGLFYFQNVGRKNYIEWYSQYSNWSSYNPSTRDDQYELALYTVPGSGSGTVTPPAHTHTECPTCHLCTAEDCTGTDAEKCQGHTVTPPATAGGSADFDTIVITANSGGDSKYTNTYTTADGWKTVNCAIQAGGGNTNPQFNVVGDSKDDKAVCLNGKKGAEGKLTSPTLKGGISKLTINFTKMFTDTNLGATVTITDLSNGKTYTYTISRELDKNEKQVVYTESWTLEAPITGDFTIEVVNTAPSGNTSSNKDRLTILDLIWE